MDGLTGRWVLLAPERGARPHTVAASPPTDADAIAACPFCPGHEDRTPPEVWRAGPGLADGPGWRVRVVPNLYPLVGGEHAVPPATGAHEVVILSPAHDRSFGQLDDTQAAEAFGVVRDRVRHHLAAGRAFVQAIINHGRAAGASIAHPHAQVVALDIVPPAVVGAAARFAVAEDDPVVTDADAGVTIVDGRTRAWCPHASSGPYQFRIASAAATARFDAATDEQVTEVALVLRDVLGRLIAAIGDVPYNLVVHTTSRDEPFHWWVDVQPRLAVIAGFELGTGIFANIVAPEVAAAQLRSPSNR